MEAHEAAESIREAGESEDSEHERDARFRRRAALAIAIMAALLALSSVLGLVAIKQEINANVDSTDYNATLNSRRLELRTLQVAVRDNQEQLADPALPAEVRKLLQEHNQEDQAEIQQVQSDPGGEGIQQLQDKLRIAERQQVDTETRGTSYHAAEAVFEISIVLASVAILIVSVWLLYGSVALAIVALVALLNGITLLVRF